MFEKIISLFERFASWFNGHAGSSEVTSERYSHLKTSKNTNRDSISISDNVDSILNKLEKDVEEIDRYYHSPSPFKKELTDKLHLNDGVVIRKS